MAEMLVPLSMAILTDYDEDQLGIDETEKAGEETRKEK